MKLRIFLFVIISLFTFDLVSAQGLVASAQPAKGYMLRPGDELEGKVTLEPQFDFKVTVDEDGMIELPFADNRVVAKCRTVVELQADVKSLLGKYLRTPQLGIQIQKRNIAPATVYGEVNRPLEVELQRRRATLVELLALAGGVKEEAGGMVQVFRTVPPICTDGNDAGNWKAESNDPSDVPWRMYSLASIRLGKEEANPVIYPGDVIYVQKASPVYITGEVVSPQGIYLKEGGLSLVEAIGKVSGFRREAKTTDIKISRLKPNSKDRETITANYKLIKQGVQKDIMLEPHDIVDVGVSKDPLGLTILKYAIGAAKAAGQSVTSSVGTKVIY